MRTLFSMAVIAGTFMFMALLALDALEFELTGECQDCLVMNFNKGE